MSDQPLGIADVSVARDRLPRGTGTIPDHWYWCRKHEKAEHVNEPQIASDATLCIRIGPFMSKREAERLDQGFIDIDRDEYVGALGMGVDL